MSTHPFINNGGYPESIDPCDPLAPWNRPDQPAAEEHACPICNEFLRCKAEWDDGWYLDRDTWYSVSADGREREHATAGEGPDGKLYCSDSCRMQAMFNAATPQEKAGLKRLLRGCLIVAQARRDLGLRRDGLFPATNGHALERMLTGAKPEYSPLRAWLGDTAGASAMSTFVEAGLDLYDALYGTADNEQPAWLREVEGE